MGNSSSSGRARAKQTRHFAQPKPNQNLPAQQHKVEVAKISLPDPSPATQTCKSLLQLPDKILINIMGQLSPAEMTKLRHVSARFLILFDGCFEFQKYHAKESWKFLPQPLWAVPDPAYFFSGQETSTLKPLCASCAQKRGRDVLGRHLLISMPYLYCSGCKQSHRSMHFSEQQREEKNDEDRACIGHEAFIRLDAYTSFSWRQAVAAARSSCQDMVARYSGDADLSECSSRSCAFRPKTSANFRELPGNKFRMTLTRTYHIPVEHSENGKICAKALLNSTVIGKEDTNPIEYLYFGIEAIRRSFDPNVCSCLDWGKFGFPQGVWGTPQFNGKQGSPSSRQYLRHGYVGRQGRCLGRQHGFTSEYDTGRHDVDIFQCPVDANMIAVRVSLTSICESASDPAWRCLVDNASWHAGYDQSMRGINWCPDSNCGVWDAQDRHQSLYELEKRHGW